jgi:simple sugar transport system permease protein
MIVDVLLTQSTMISAVRLSVPLILAALGGAATSHANVFNIALEGFMLIATFFSAWGAIVFESAWIGLLTGIMSSTVCALLFGILLLKLKANNIVVGLALNLGLLGLTTWLLQAIFGVRGYIQIESGGFPNIHLPLVEEIPYIGGIISGHNLLVYAAILLAIFADRFLYDHTLGIRLRAVGEYPEAAESVGVPVMRYRLVAILVSGVLCGVAGSFLTLGGSSIFSENMTAGKGFIALAVVAFSQGRPLLIVFSSLLFGYAEAIAVLLQQFGWPSQIMLSVPYLITVIALWIMSLFSDRQS